MPGYRKRLETLTTDIIDGTEANHFFETGVIKTKPTSWKDYFFPAVHDRAGT